jgi:hypothetical protein
MQFEYPLSGVRAGRTWFLSAVLIVASALATVGCGDDDSTGPGGVREGTGTVVTTGAVTASGSGQAIFQSMSSGTTRLFQLVVAPANTSGTNAWSLQIVSTAGRPAAGTYQLSPLSGSGSNLTATFYYVNGGAIEMFNSTSGELVITSSSPSAVRGTIAFTGRAAIGGTSTVTTEGAFNAPCAPGFGCQ